MGGSKSKKYEDIAIAQMFNQDDDILSLHMVQISASARTFNGFFIFSKLIDNLKWYMNYDLIENAGVAGTGRVVSSGVNEQTVKSALLQRDNSLDDASICFYSSSYSDSYSGTVYRNFPCENIIGYLDDNNDISVFNPIETINDYYKQYSDQSGSKNVTLTFTFSRNKDVWPSSKTYMFSYDVTVKCNGFRDIPIAGSYYIDGANNIDYATDIQKDGKIYSFDSDQSLLWSLESYSVSGRVVHVKLSTTATYKSGDGSTINVVLFHDEDTFQDNRNFFFVWYTGTRGGETTSEGAIIPKEYITHENVVYHSLMYVTKKDGAFIADQDKKNLIYSNFGLIGTDFEEQVMQNSNVKDVMIAYLAEYNDPDLGSKLKKIYGTSADPKDITFDGEISLKYQWMPEQGYYDVNSPSELYLKYRDAKTNAIYGNDNAKQTLLVPFEIIDGLDMREKYDFIKKTLCVFAYSEVVVNIKWYQTGFFKAVLTFLAIILSALTGGSSIYLISIVAVPIISSINEKIGAVAALIFAIITFNPSSVANITIDSIKLAGEIAKQYFIEMNERIVKEMDLIVKDSKTVQEKISDMTHHGLYMPLDSIDSFYDNLYSMQYNYDAMYDYDKFYEPRTLI